MSRWISTALVIALIALGGLAVGSSVMADGGDAVASADAHQLVADGALLLDVRTPREFDAGHIEGAVNIPVQELRARVDELGSTESPIVVYCRSGNRSHHAKMFLESQGFDQVHDLGSYRNW